MPAQTWKAKGMMASGRLWRILSVATAVLVAGAGDGHAASSRHTTLDGDKCQLIDKAKEGEGEWARFRCPAVAGWRVQLDAGDLREWVRIRPRSSPNWVTLRGPVTAFNRIGPKMEWRYRTRNGQPFAVIYRITTTRNDRCKNRTYLYVAKLGPDGICLVAIVHQSAKPSQNIAARNFADNVAAGFNCLSGKPLVVR